VTQHDRTVGATDRRPAKAPTIVDVAAHAGVSKSTVSNVIRGAPTVGPALRRLVLEAIDELGYRPNGLARQLAQARSTTIGVITGGLDNQFFAQMAIALERSASRRGYGVMLCNGEGEADRELEGIERLLEHRVAGILMATSGSGDRAQKAVGWECPMVFICDGVSSCDLVSVEDASGTRQAAAHLLSLGHRRVLYLSNPSIEPATARARLQGFCAATRGQTTLALVGNVSSGKVMVGNELFELGSLVRAKRITGVVCVNDSTALEVLDQLERQGLSVPNDVSVVGFDNIAMAGLARISLTTVAQPIATIADDAVQLLCARINGALQGSPRVLRHPVSLVVRATTAPPRGLARG
jgi:LacI family transcriptional regulator